MDSDAGAGLRSVTSSSGITRRVPPAENAHGHDAPPPSRRSSVSLSRGHSTSLTGERTVERLRLSKALTVPEDTTVHEACRRMASRRVDAVLLTDSNAFLCGILTDKDIATRVIARELKVEETPVSKVMTRNPVFVLADTLVVEALQKMVQGMFRHLPVVENGEVIGILDITKCLYDAIARMERAAEKGKAIAAAEIEKHWGAAVPGPINFAETLQERMFRPLLSTIISENSKFFTVAPSDTVLTASKKMLEFKVSSSLVAIENKPRGILTSRDLLMRVIAQNLPPESTTVEEVMTPSPDCASVDTPIVDALHIMHDGKFLHLPVLDHDRNVVTVVDVLHIAHAAIAIVGNSLAARSEATSAIDDDDDSRRSLTGKRTVKRLRLSKALTIPDHTTVREACRRMASRRVDVVLLTDSNGLLCGILTDKDITTRVIALELKMEETPVSKVMTRSPVFVLADTLVVEALQKMVHGKFRHMPVVENGEVIAILDIAKCLYDAIAKMERAAARGKAIDAAVEGVEKHLGAEPGHNNFAETLRERMFRPSLSTIISENSKFVTVAPSDTVLTASKKMLELKVSSAAVAIENKPGGILTPRDILMRVIAQNLPPESTTVEKVMTQSPECGTVDTPILDALHTMHDGKFLHLPVLDRDGNVVTVVDVLHITHAAIATVGNSGAAGSEATSAMMQRFWDSAMSIGPIDDDDDSRSEGSTKVASEATDIGRTAFFPASGLSNTFGFKIQDKQGRMHRFNCETSSLTELITSILQRVGDDIDRKHLPQILYEDEDHDKVILSSDSDLIAAVDHARQIGWKSLRLHLDYAGVGRRKRGGGSSDFEYAGKDAWASAYSAVAAGAALVAGLGVMAYLKRSG